MCLLRDQLLAQNFDAVLAVIVKLAGDPIFAKFCQDALYHILRHPISMHTAGLHWGLGTGWGGVGMWWGWVGMGAGMGAGNDSCGWEWRMKPFFFDIPDSLL